MRPVGVCLQTLMIVSSLGLQTVFAAEDEFAVNIAYGKSATQSSTYIRRNDSDDTPGFPYDAYLAIDGNNNTDNGCSHTDLASYNSAWWEVDLQGLYRVSSIVIHQRTNENTDWSRGFVIKGRLNSNSYDVISNTPSLIDGTITIPVQTSVRFKGIKIELNKENAAICLCEVEVLAEWNVAELKNASQSSTYFGKEYGDSGYYNASLAVDGNTNPYFHNNSCSHTDVINAPSWWEVDLKALYPIIGIRIHQRADSNTRWLSGYTLSARKSSGAYATINTQNYNEGIISIKLQSPMIFSAVKINMPSRSICLCEVEVFAGIMCPSPPNIPKNSIQLLIPGIAGNGSFNSFLNITCMNGYILNGSNSVTCTGINYWQGQLGHCSDINECMQATQCRARGQCSNFDGGFSCHCIAGFEGTHCEADIDECKQATACHGRGQCANSEGSFSCHCNSGYSGTNCDDDIDECKQTSVCHGRGQCSNYDGSFSCNCNSGYTGTNCEDVIHCNNEFTALDHGTLTFTGGIKGNGTYNTSATAICDQGYNLTMTTQFRCNESGQWEGSFGSCSVIRCPSLYYSGRNGRLVNMNMGLENRNDSFGARFQIECDEGYISNTTREIVCTTFAMWNATVEDCQATLRNEEPGSNVAGVAGGVAAAICLAILGVIIGFILYKRRTRGPEDTIVDTTLSELPSSSKRTEQKHEEIVAKSIYAQPKKIKYPEQNPECDESKNTYMNSNDSSKEYYYFAPQKLTDKHSVRVEELPSLFLSRKMEPNLYEEEYNTLPDGLTKLHETALLPENRSKNRYKNIYPYDDTRVILEIWDPSNENDYINACYVNGFKTYHTYIAAQGPTKGILNDFWRMIWQTKCRKIVMLTNLTEEGKHKCEQYWPDEGSVEYGDIVIRLIQCETFSDFTIRTLSIEKTNGKSKGGKTKAHQISQFHFTAWPDRGVPRFASSLVHFRQKIRAAHTRQQAEGPMIVHCSAGIGRTGTFLALDYLLDQAEELGYINVVKCVETIRKQRVNLVQTLEQYIFLHEALLEALTCTTMAVSTSEFQETHRKLLEIDITTRKRMLDDEFEKLPMYVSDPEEDVYANAKNVENRHKNRYSNILPDKNHCPFLNVYVKGRDSYINAVFLPAYKENNIFIITQTPLENTIVDFWRMVYQFEVGSIVMLNTLSEMKEDERYWTEDNKMLEIGPFRITLESKSCDDICTNYTMLLKYQEEQRRRVRLSRAAYWEDGKPVPMSSTAMLKQIDLIEKWQQESGSKPIIVHCMNGAEKSGLFCVIAALLERTKIEQDVAVEHIIKQMRSRRPQIIPNVDQFKFCYDAMLAYLNQFDTYSNFTGL